MFIPNSTYRIQFHQDFGFKDLQNMLPYLQQLGISTIYASPIFKARPGSSHGYDTVDVTMLNPEIGTLKEFEKLQKELKKRGMSWLQDIVPNHMAFDQHNSWLMDVLELGPQSKFYHFFDIDWNHPNYPGKVMVPFLGDKLKEVLSQKQIKLVWDESGLHTEVYDNRYPVSVLTWEVMLELAKQVESPAKTKEQLNRFSDDFLEFYQKTGDFDHEGWQTLKHKFGKALKRSKHLKVAALATTEYFNNHPEQLRRLLEKQFYKLAHWKKTDQEINYRRFFTINELICLNIQNPEVFEAHHKFVLELVNKGYIQGLRIDHIDGLYHPQEYLERLRKAAPDAFISVEKILELEEHLPKDWAVQGTTGYGFLAIVNHLFTRFGESERFSDIYRKIVPEMPEYHELVFQKKEHMLRNHMQGELNNLLRLMHQLHLQPQHISDDDLKETLLTWLALFPVYRLYGSQLPLSGEDNEILHQTLNATQQRQPHLQPAVEHLRRLFTNSSEAPGTEENRLKFLMRCQQFTGPLAAKGVEDTTFYHYNRFISHNEVGDSPEWFGITPEYFHERMRERSQYWPQAQNATATHDTKRGEDARIDLNVLSEIPDEWEQAVNQWRELNQKFVHQNEEGKNIPSRNDEYFLYQALLAAYPVSGELERDLVPRLKQHMTKAIREAKVRSDWGDPNEAYEKGVHQFIDNIFRANHGFREAIQPVLKKISYYGMLYSLGQVLLKCTAPGVPDIYQGCELWELSMVDPDNRRPVEYELRQQYLTELQEQFMQQPDQLISQLKTSWTDGRIKQFTLWQALQLRQKMPDLFSQGRYIPLETSGSRGSHLVAFARQWEQQWCIVLVPHELVNVIALDEWPLREQTWQDSAIQFPEEAPGKWKNIFDNRTLTSSGSISVAKALQHFPVAVLVGVEA